MSIASTRRPDRIVPASAPTILIIEDQLTMIRALEQLIEPRGYRTRAATSGEAGLPLIDGADLVLLDLMLPGMDGYATCREIRLLRPELPVIMLTARAEPDSLVTAFGAGADDYVTKPFRGAELIARVESRLRLHRTEALLRESIERYEMVQLATDDTIYDRDLGTGRVTWSEGITAVLGHPAPAGNAGFDWWSSRIHPDDRRQALASLEDACRHRDSWSAEYRFRRADGSFATVLDRARIRRGADGSALRMIGSMQDISERIRMEQELRAAKAHVEHLLVASPAVVYTARPAGDFATTFVSSNVERQLGYGAEHFTADPAFWLRHVHPDDRTRTVASAALVLDRGQLVHEYRFRHRDGGYRWMRDELRLLRDADGKAQEIVGYWVDMTDRKEAEDALRASESRYRRFFEDDLTGDFIARADGTLVECNQAFVRILGFAEVAEARGTSLLELFPDAGASAGLLEELHELHHLELREIPLRRRDGRHVDVVANLIGTFDGAGALTEIRGYLFDVTERRSLEAQLAQAQKMEVVGRLAGGIAHDFNNLLTAITGNVDILLDELPADDPTREPLEEIASAAERSARLTRQLLAYSRKQILQLATIDPNQIVRGMESFIRRLIGEDIVVTTKLCPDLGHIHVDPGQMEQVLMNLVVNARDAMPDGGTLEIRTICADVDPSWPLVSSGELAVGRYAVLSVSDSGCGMDRYTMGRIFEPFFTTKEVGKGTGLGLASVYGIVKQSGGSIAVDSEVGRGASFTIYLPVVGDGSPGEPSRRVAARKAAAGGSATILLVEDERAVRTLIRTVLERSGYTVIEAENALDAQRRVHDSAGEIDLLLTDVVMPGMNGRALGEELLQKMPKLRVLYMSGYSDRAVPDAADPQEGIAFIAKPFTPDLLRNRVSELLGTARG